jgi:hypothetical protein
MTKEMVSTCPMYVSDLEKVKAFKEAKKLKKLADAVRICIEFTNAHGGLS